MRQLQIGDFSAEIDDSHCHGLYRGLQPVGLSDVPRKVLFRLLQQRPRPVMGKLLLRELWHPGANPSNLAKQVRVLRAAMGDEGSQRYIMTVGKEGYAFVMPVTESVLAEENHSPPTVTVATVVADPVSKAEWRLA